MTWSRALLACSLATLVACSAAPAQSSDGGTSTDDAGTPTDGGTPQPPAGPELTATEALGGYLPASTRAVLPGVQSNVLIIGHVPSPIDAPQDFGLASSASLEGYAIPAGLTILDTATGQARDYTSADGLPTMNYQDFSGAPAGDATVPTFALAWVTPDVSFVSASWTHLVIGTSDGAGGWTFRATTLRADGASQDASVTTVAVAGGEIYAGSDQGVAVVDPSDLSVKRWLTMPTSGVAWVYGLTAGVLDGPTVAVLYGPAGSSSGQDVATAKAGASVATLAPLSPVETPTTVQGLDGSILIGVRQDDGRGAVEGLVQTADATVLQTVISADELATLAKADRPFVPNRIAYDATNAELLVGGSITTLDGGASGGLFAFQAVANGTISGHGRPLVDTRRTDALLLPWRVEALEVDDGGRVYVDGAQLCDELHARETGLYRIERDGDDARVVRPLVSGVRAITIDPVAHDTWLGLRDENPGLGCDGFPVQQSVCRLKADGSCEVYAPRVTTGDTDFPASIGAAAIAFGDPAKKQLAIATTRDATFVRAGDTTEQLSTQIDPGLSLFETSAAWTTDGLWLGSLSEWDSAPPDPNDPIDWTKVNDRGPHGLGLVQLADDGRPTGYVRYSRNQSDVKDYDVPGLPSNTVWDVLPLDGTRHVLAALGIERGSRGYDHVLPDPHDGLVTGGLAEVNNRDVTVIAPPDGVTFGDVVGLARGKDGALFALDADAGLFSIDLATHRATKFADAAWSAPTRAVALAADDDGTLAVTTTDGLWLYGADGGVTEVEAARTMGFGWSVRFVAPGVLLAGFDRGLLRLALGSATLPARGPSGALALDLWDLPQGCGGEVGCTCHEDRECVFGSSCTCDAASDCTCETPHDPCVDDPGSAGCACSDDSECGSGLSCHCDGDACECAVVDDACLAHCTCPGTDDGCLDGYTCHSGIVGQSCVQDDPTACAQDCSCSGAGTTDGCPDGTSCISGFAGPTCQ